MKSSLCPLSDCRWWWWWGGLSAFGFYMFIYAVVFPYISLLVDCFEWAIIGNIEQWTVNSVFWQFQKWGPSAFGIYMFYVCTDISLYFLISCPFRIGSHWWHWTANSSLSALAVSDIVSFTWVNLKIWAHFKICCCLSETKDQWHCVIYMFRSYCTCDVYGAWTSTAVLIFFFYI